VSADDGPGGTDRQSHSLEAEASEQERFIIEALADLRDMDVREVMTPRVDVTYLEISRKVRQPYLLPETLGVLEALADMRKHHRAVAVVVDEYGGVAGLLTVKDLLEPLVGDLHDEFDEDEEALIVRVDNTRWLIDGQTNVDDVRERIGIEIPDGEYVTLGGLLFERCGHIPAEGEAVRVGDWDMRVVEMDKRRVAQVVATFAGGDPGAAPASPDGGGAGGSDPSANGTGEAAG
jgi:CBS domain containing-hemolysin-like protein